jgi:hypothetical protein
MIDASSWNMPLHGKHLPRRLNVNQPTRLNHQCAERRAALPPVVTNNLVRLHRAHLFTWDSRGTSKVGGLLTIKLTAGSLSPQRQGPYEDIKQREP